MVLNGVGKLPETIDWPLHTQPAKPRNRRFLFLIAIVAIILLGSRTAISYWVDLLWFRSLGYGEVFWKTRGLEWGVFAGFAVVTFLVLHGRVFRAEAGTCGGPAEDAFDCFRRSVDRSSGRRW